MKLSKGLITIITGLSMLVSVALLSCSNSSNSGGGSSSGTQEQGGQGGSGGQGGGQNPTWTVSENIKASKTNEGIKIQLFNLNGTNRIDVYRFSGDTLDLSKQQRVFMTNHNNLDEYDFEDKYVENDVKYTYILNLSGNRYYSNSVTPDHGKGLVQLTAQTCDGGIELKLEGIDRQDKQLDVSRYTGEAVHEHVFMRLYFSKYYTSNVYPDLLVTPSKKYCYQATLYVEGDSSGNLPTIYAYSEPVIVTAGKYGKGNIEMVNKPAAKYNSSKKEMIFTVKPVIEPDLDTIIAGYQNASYDFSFYSNGSWFASWVPGADSFAINDKGAGKYTIDGYCISINYRNGEPSPSFYYYRQDEKLAGLEEVEIR